MKGWRFSGIRFLRDGVASVQALVLVLLSVSVVVPEREAVAIEYTSSGLYDARELTLENGFRVVLKPRRGARTVSLRLAVDVGHWDFPCGRQETAHLLEHLLFTGTTDHEETELDRLIESHGGTWNATTRPEETVYEIDIFSPHADLALDTLFEIMSKSEISHEDVHTSREIVHREMGGRPSFARLWLYELGVGKSAWSNAWEILGKGTHAGCSWLETADAISREDILDAYATYYVPGNMMLVVVGDFERSRMLDRIENTFGRLPAGETPKRHPIELLSPNKGLSIESRFSPLLDSEAYVFLLFQVPDRASEERYALRVLEAYLDKRVYEVLRVNHGYSYAPAAESSFKRDFGLMATYADVYVENIEAAIEAMQTQVDRVLDGKLKESEVEDVKRKLLLAEARRYERNSDIAEHYIEARHSISSSGTLVNEADRIAGVTAEDVIRIARESLGNDNEMILKVAPTLTYTELVLWASGTLGFAFLWGVHRWVRRLKSRRTHVDFLL